MLRVDGPIVDVWSFDATAGQVVEVAVTADTFATRHHLIAPTGNVIRTGSGRETILLPVDGRYLLSLADTRADAYEISMRPALVAPLVDEPGVGILGDGDGADVWSFDGVAGQVVSVRAAWENFELRGRMAGEIISPTGKRLAGDGWEEESLHMVAVLPVEGRYLVSLEARWTTASVPYELAVRVLQGTRPLEWGRPVDGFFSGDGPKVGIWEFDGSVGQVANVRAQCAAFKCRVLLVSPSGGAVFGRNSLTGTRPRLTDVLAASGRYRVMLVADDEAVGVYGVYRVWVGSTTVTPRPVEVNGPAVVDHRSDVNLWSFQGAATQVVSVTAYPSKALMTFDLISPAGHKVAMNDGQMVVRLPLDGRYLVRGYGTRGYTGSYGVVVSTVPVEAETPATLGMNAPARGELDQHGSGTGVWEFEGTEGQTISIAVHGDDPVVQLLSPIGEELGWASAAGYSVHARLEARLPITGRYLIRVLAHNDRWTAPNRTAYEIEVRSAPAPSVPR